MIERQINVADQCPFLAEDSTFKVEVSEMELQLKQKESSQQHSLINDVLKGNAILILSFLQTKSERAKQVSLQSILKLMISPADPVNSLKSLFETCAAILSVLKLDLPEFIHIQANFSFYLIFYSTLFKFTKIDIMRCLGTEDLRLIWLSFVILAPNLNDNQANTRLLNLLCTLIFKVIYMNEMTPEKLNEMNLDFDRELGFKLDISDYNTKHKLIANKLSDFNTPAFNFEKRRQGYIDSLGPHDIDLLIFLSSLETDNNELVTYTPINRRSMSLNSPQSNLRKMVGKSDKAPGNCLLMDRKTAFEKVVEHYQSPEKRINQNDQNNTVTFGRSESRDHSRELASAAQWYKDQVKSVVLCPIDAEHNDFNLCSQFFKRYTENPEIRERLKEAVREVKQKSNDDKNALAFFYCVLDKLITAESSESNKIDLLNLIRERNFLQSVICFSLDLGALINKTTKLRFEEVMQMCKCGHLDVWKIIYSFNKAVGRQLPNTLKMRLSELETDILLRAIWSESGEQRCLARSMFAATNLYSDLAIKHILRLSAERLFVISTKNFELAHQEVIWELVKKLLFYGINDEANSTDISFKTNKHLDFLILASVYHVGLKNSKNLKMKDLVSAYFNTVAFPTVLSYAEFQSYYCNSFKKTVKELSGDEALNWRVPSKSKVGLNDTPIQSHVKKRMEDFVKTPLRSIIPVTLERRPENADIPVLPAFSSDKKFRFPIRFECQGSPDDLSRRSGPTGADTPMFGFQFPSPFNTPQSNFFFGDSFHNSTSNPQLNFSNNLFNNDGTETPKFKEDEFKK